MAWAFATSQSMMKPSVLRAFFAALGTHLQICLEESAPQPESKLAPKPQELSNLCWAFATVYRNTHEYEYDEARAVMGATTVLARAVETGTHIQPPSVLGSDKCCA